MYKFDEEPFGSSSFNSSYYRSLMDKEEKVPEPEDQDAIVVEPIPSKEDDPFLEVDRQDSRKMLDGATKHGFGKHMDSLVRTAQDELSNGQSSELVAQTFTNLFKDLNETYGLDVQFDFNSFSNTLGYIIKPRNKAAIDVYISEAYSRVSSTLYIMYLNAIAQLSSQILDPRFIESNSMSYADKLTLMRELFQYIQNLNDIKKEVEVKDADVKLRRLADDKGPKQNDLNSDEVQEFLANLASAIKNK